LNILSITKWVIPLAYHPPVHLCLLKSGADILPAKQPFYGLRRFQNFQRVLCVIQNTGTAAEYCNPLVVFKHTGWYVSGLH
jgi:hypothetical protein